MASASVISRIRQDEVIKPSTASVWNDLKEGLAVVLKDKRLRSIAGSTATSNFFSNVTFAILILFLVQQLGYTVLVIGTIFFIGGLGAFAGIAVSSRLARILGVGLVIISAIVVGGIGTIQFFLSNTCLLPSLISSLVVTFFHPSKLTH